MNSSILVSVIMVSYNGEPFMNRSLNAIKSQTVRDFELIFVDNGSSDQTYKIICDFKEENPDINLTIIKLEKNDLSKAWTDAVLQAKGIYILKNDVDDWMEPACLEELSKKALKTDADIVACCYQNVTDTKVLRKRHFSSKPSKWSLVEQQGVMYKKSLIINELYCPFEYIKAGDLYFMMNWCNKAKSISFINKVLYNYLSTPVSNFNAKKIESVLINYQILTFSKKIYDMQTSISEKKTIQYSATKKVYDIINSSFSGNADFSYTDLKSMLADLRTFFPKYKYGKLMDKGYTIYTNFAFFICRMIDALGLWKIVYLIRK